SQLFRSASIMRQLLIALCVFLMGTACALGQATDAADLPSESTSLSTLPQETGGYFYGDVEFLLRWFKPVCASVPIVSIGNPQDPVPGALGQPGTQVVVGGSPPHKFEFPMTPGGQIKIGWNRGDGSLGFFVSGFLMEQAANSQHFTTNANGSPN